MKLEYNMINDIINDKKIDSQFRTIMNNIISLDIAERYKVKENGKTALISFLRRFIK